MATQTSMLHVRIDKKLEADATETLASVGLTVSDAVRILLTRITKDGGLPAGLTMDPTAHDTWFVKRYWKCWPTLAPAFRTTRPWPTCKP